MRVSVHHANCPCHARRGAHWAGQPLPRDVDRAICDVVRARSSRPVMSGAMVQRNEKGHDFDLDTGACTRCGMTIKEYEGHGRPPCPGNKGERSGRSSGRDQQGMGRPRRA